MGRMLRTKRSFHLLPELLRESISSYQFVPFEVGKKYSSGHIFVTLTGDGRRRYNPEVGDLVVGRITEVPSSTTVCMRVLLTENILRYNLADGKWMRTQDKMLS